MAAAIHQETRSGGQRPEALDHQPVADEGEMVEQVIKERAGHGRIVAVRTGADPDILG